MERIEIDLTVATDDQLDALRVEVAIERERRERLAQIPGEVKRLAAVYVAGGGEQAALASAVTEGASSAALMDG